MYSYATSIVQLDGATGISSYIPFVNGSGIPNAAPENVVALGVASTLVSVSANIVSNTLDQPLILTLFQNELQIAQGITNGGAEILQLTISDSAIVEDGILYYKLSSTSTLGRITISSIRMETI